MSELFRVRVSATRPKEPGVAVEYREHWYYIPDSDHASTELTGREPCSVDPSR
jgi:hypothetical protein